MSDMEGTAIQTLPKGQKVGVAMELYAGRLMPANFGQVIEFAQMMCKAGLAIPKHLRDNPGICMSVIQRSLAWELDPWAVATKTYAVNDILAYESQLIAAVVKKWAPIKERVIPYKFSGEGGELMCSITLHHNETDEEIFYASPKKKDITVQNSPLWKSDPQQQLGYYTIRALARRHFPEILMGVYDREEVMSMRDITPAMAVDNLLNDEPIQLAIQDAAVHGMGMMLNEPGKESVRVPMESFVREAPADLPETEVKITPSLIAANLIKAISSHTSKTHLEEWQHDNHADINTLPDLERRQVRKALDDKHVELEEY